MKTCDHGGCQSDASHVVVAVDVQGAIRSFDATTTSENYLACPFHLAAVAEAAMSDEPESDYYTRGVFVERIMA